MTPALVVGAGSIGRRHARVLTEMGLDVAVVSRRDVAARRRFAGLAEALAQHRPDYVVIANETARHRETLAALDDLDYVGTVLVEKPLFEASEPAYRSPNPRVFVAYNLRFHPLLQRLLELVAAAEVVSVEVHVGQHLPSWRPGRDYRTTYSARADLGGGVLRDLSHELDYVVWLFGGWRRLSALGTRSGALEIDSDDMCSLLMTCERCPIVTVTMNYLDRRARRQILVNTKADTILVDLIAGTIESGERPDRESVTIDRDFTYRAEHEALLCGTSDAVCSFDEGLEIVRMIEAAERAASDGTWIER